MYGIVTTIHNSYAKMMHFHCHTNVCGCLISYCLFNKNVFVCLYTHTHPHTCAHIIQMETVTVRFHILISMLQGQGAQPLPTGAPHRLLVLHTRLVASGSMGPNPSVQCRAPEPDPSMQSWVEVAWGPTAPFWHARPVAVLDLRAHVQLVGLGSGSRALGPEPIIWRGSGGFAEPYQDAEAQTWHLGFDVGCRLAPHHIFGQ